MLKALLETLRPSPGGHADRIAAPAPPAEMHALGHRPCLWRGIAPRQAMDAPRGFEPRLAESKSAVLPLDDGAMQASPARQRRVRQFGGGKEGRIAMHVTNRRHMLSLTAGIGVAASAGLLLAGCGKDDDHEEEVTANEDLMREHGVLRRILVLYRELAPRIAAD